MNPLTQQEILSALQELSSRLEKEGIRGEVCLFGGAAMVLAFQARQSTKDIDAIFAPTPKIREIALQIAFERNWDQGWFNDGVKGFLSTRHETTSAGLPQFSHLNVTIPVPEYLFAMKCMAARVGLSENQDFADALILKKHLKLHGAEEAFELVEKYYPQNRIPPRSQYFIESLFEKAVE